MNEHSRTALVAAIGGTYFSLAIADIDELTISNFALLSSADFEKPTDAIQRYLSSVPRCPDKVGVAVTGQVSAQMARMDVRPWTFSARDIMAVTGAEHVTWYKSSAKVRRIRNDPHVLLAPCDARGRMKGEQVAGLAALQSPDETVRIAALIRKRYGFLGWMLTRRGSDDRTGIRISVD